MHPTATNPSNRTSGTKARISDNYSKAPLRQRPAQSDFHPALQTRLAPGPFKPPHNKHRGKAERPFKSRGVAVTGGSVPWRARVRASVPAREKRQVHSGRGQDRTCARAGSGRAVQLSATPRLHSEEKQVISRLGRAHSLLHVCALRAGRRLPTDAAPRMLHVFGGTRRRGAGMSRQERSAVAAVVVAGIYRGGH